MMMRHILYVDGDKITGYGGWRQRAIYADPQHVRRYSSRKILDACERSAAGEGFFMAEPTATMTGELIYLVYGHQSLKNFSLYALNELSAPLILMQKRLSGPHSARI